MFAALAAFAAAVLVFWLDRAVKPVALHLADGRPVPVALGGERASTVALDDGSELGVSPGARLEVLDSTGGAFTLALRRGTAEFEVHPGGPRVWRVECAGVEIEVVGTHFTVARTVDSLRVSVERGVVLVRGDAVVDRVVRLSAGQFIVVPLSNPESAPTTKAQEPNAIPEAVRSTTAPVAGFGGAHGASAAPRSATNDGAQSNRAAFATNDGGVAAPDPIEIALTGADSLRRSGQFHEAAIALETLLAEHAGDSRAPLTEFSLGRLYLDSLGDPNRAAEHFSRALVRRLPAALAEDARARLVEAYARAGNRAAAENAASVYLALYPNGRRLDDVRRWARYGL
jgi:transmembrane sensor